MLDVYPNVDYRVCKDNNGGFGTGNDLGDNFVSKILKSYLKRSIDFPPLSFVSSMGQLRKNGYDIIYSREILDTQYDLCILATSIVAHESELQAISKLKKMNVPVIAIGPFATSLPEPYIKKGAKVVIGEPEFYFLNFNLNNKEIKNLPKKILFSHFILLMTCIILPGIWFLNIKNLVLVFFQKVLLYLFNLHEDVHILAVIIVLILCNKEKTKAQRL